MQHVWLIILLGSTIKEIVISASKLGLINDETEEDY